MNIYKKGEIVANQKGNFRVITDVVEDHPTLTPHYVFMELPPISAGSYFLSYPQGSTGTQDFYTFDREHYLFIVK